MSHRNWCFTYYYEDAPLDYNGAEDIGSDHIVPFRGQRAIDELFQLKYRGILFSEEMGRTECHPHLQGFIRMHRGCDLTRMLGVFRDFRGIHLEPSYDPVKAIAYCRKGDTDTSIHLGGPHEDGDLVFEQGENTELTAYKLYMKNTKIPKWSYIANNMPGVIIRYPNGASRLMAIQRKIAARQQYLDTPLDTNPFTVEVYYGPTSTGKSSIQRKYGHDVYSLEQAKGQRDVWFSDYDGEAVLFIDDFYGWIPYSRLLRLLRNHPQQLEGKGTTDYKMWTTVVITSNSPPWKWYKNIGFPPELAARITKLYWIESIGATPRDDTYLLPSFINHPQALFPNIQLDSMLL